MTTPAPGAPACPFLIVILIAAARAIVRAVVILIAATALARPALVIVAQGQGLKGRKRWEGGGE